MYGRYDHMQFRRHWALQESDWYLLGCIDGIVRAICEVPVLPDTRKKLLMVSLQKGAQATTAIEGNTLTDDEVARVAQGESLPISKQYQEVEVRNVLDAMNDLLREVVTENQDELVTPELIKRFHYMIGQDLGEHFDAIPGQFRHDARTVGGYRCPDYRDVPELVDRLCKWLKVEFGYPSGDQPIYNAIVEAIIAHVYLEWIHPFADGNGRAGRLLEFYILLRAGMPDIASHILSNFYNLTRSEYYRQLDIANKTRDLSSFIRYALQGLHDGLEETLSLVQQAQFEVAWTGYVYEVMGRQRVSKMNVLRRRRTLVLNMEIGRVYHFDELPLATPEVAREYATLSDRTLERDLNYLEKQCELVMRDGDQYTANSSILYGRMARRRTL